MTASSRCFGTFAVCLCLLFLLGCGDNARARRTLRKVGAQDLRAQALEACRDGFNAKTSIKIAPEHWPERVRAFEPLGLWAEPDGAYLLLDSDVDGERGIFLPRILSEKDPLCSPTLKHVKLADGVYWYEKKR
jgi:hypothetical protein